MRDFVAAGLIAAQLLGAPAFAADLIQDGRVMDQQAGAFAGARLRIALDGGRRERGIRAGLVMAPTMRSQALDGRAVTRFGEGVELGVAPDRPVTLSVAGLPLTGDARRAPDRRAGVSTLGWIGIGVGVVVVLVIAAGVTCQETNCLGSE